MGEALATTALGGGTIATQVAGGITADTALSRVLKTPPQLWTRLQADWDLHQALQCEKRKAS